MEVRGENGWQTIGGAHYPRRIVPLTFPLPLELARRGARVRIHQEGGAAAHVDAVQLAGHAPLRAQGVELSMIARLDRDLVDARGRSFEVEFAPLAPSESPRLTLAARIEPPREVARPFYFPLNGLSPLTPNSRFFAYRPKAQVGRLTIDGSLRGEPLGEPLFTDHLHPVSGHPDAPVAAWLMDDGQQLYAAVDFGSDNTLDDEADYAALVVKRGSRLERHVVRASTRGWGRAGLEGTPRSPYRHKVYELALPLSRLRGPDQAAPIELAFELYGTASNGQNDSIPLAFDPVSRRYGMMYWEQTTETTLSLQIYAEDLTPLGAPIAVVNTSVSQTFGAVVVDNVSRRFIVIWEDAAGVMARHVGTDGSLGSIQPIPGASGGIFPQAAFDPDQQRILVAWLTRTSTAGELARGRVVRADLTQAVGPTFAIGGSGGQGFGLAYDARAQAHWLTYGDSSGVWSLERRDPTGALLGSPATLPINGGSWPSIALDPVRGGGTLFIATGAGIHDVVFDASGTPVDDRLVIPGTLENASAAYDPLLDHYVVAGYDYFSGNQIRARLVGPGNQVLGNPFLMTDPSNIANWASTVVDPHRHRFVLGYYDEANTPHTPLVYLPGYCTSSSTVTVAEGQPGTPLQVRLCAPPRQPASVAVVSTSTAQATVTPAQLNFTANNWDQPQTITVTAVADGVADGDQPFQLRLSDNSTGVDPIYEDVLQVIPGWVQDGPPCGDGVIGVGEACDDGNPRAGDGCSTTCALEPGWSCTGQPSVCVPLPGPDGGTPDASSPSDGGAQGDAAVNDAAANDSGPRPDASTADSGAAAEEDSGCGCTTTPTTRGGLWPLLGVTLLLAFRRPRPLSWRSGRWSRGSAARGVCPARRL